MNDQKVKIRQVDRVDTKVRFGNTVYGSYFLFHDTLYLGLSFSGGTANVVDLATGLIAHINNDELVEEVQEVNINFVLKHKA